MWAASAIFLTLASCGGGSDSGSQQGLLGGVTPTPSPRPGASCSLSTRQTWVLAQFNAWYLFPETLSYVNPSAFSNLSDYVDALAATARAQRRDRYFSYVTSIAEEDAYYDTGATAGFGIRLFEDAAARRLFVTEAFETAPAYAAGIDRGAEILAIGTSEATLRTVSDLMASGGLSDALGPTAAGVTRALRIRDAVGERVLTLAKADYDIAPLSPRYGARVLSDAGRPVGYLNLRTFIGPAADPMRAAFAGFRAAGVRDLIVDLRYNGGGLVSGAQLLASLMGADRHASDVLATLAYRPDKSAANEVYRFLAEANALAPRRVAFIATDATASASEMVVNALRPYLRADVALIGANSYGKPVGQIALDLPGCGDRLRLIAFSVRNAANEGDYYDGLAPLMAASCRARDNLAYPLGDPAEDSVARALDFLDGRPCTPIGGVIARAAGGAPLPPDRASAPPERRAPLVPDRPNVPQRDQPGLF